MKKYRRTKIMVKTREIISVSKTTAANETETAVCPVCRAPRAVLLRGDENRSDAARSEADTNELPTAELKS